MANNDSLKILEELKKFHAQSVYQRTKELLSKEIKEIESEIAQKQAAATEDDKKIVIKAPSRFVTELHDHAFDESDKFVKIFAPFNSCSISDDNVELELTENSFCMTIRGESKDYRFNVKNLLKAIDVSKSYRKVKSEMVSIYLKKVKEGERWGYLTSTEKRLKDNKAAAIDNEKGSTKDDPNGAIMDMMKKLYDSGDADMKRTIAKAWTEGQEKKHNQSPMF